MNMKRFLLAIALLAMMAACENAPTPPQAQPKTNTQNNDGQSLSFRVMGVDFTMMKVEGCPSGNFYMAKTEVTQALWKVVMGSAPTLDEGWKSQYGKGSDYPAYRVSWNDCQTFVAELNRMLKDELGGKRFDLPTVAQWEYAARGGNKDQGCPYSGSFSVDKVAWYEANSGGQAHTVAQWQSNELGIYDMSGNVREWCADLLGDSDDGQPDSLTFRVICGGSWSGSGDDCLLSARSHCAQSLGDIDLGFRFVLQ